MRRNKGKTTPWSKALAAVMAAVMLLMAFTPPGEAKAEEVFYGPVPKAMEGRILTPDMTGDSVNWVEIARSGENSLIVRTDYLKKSYRHDEPYWHMVYFGTSNAYAKSTVRDRVNNWFNGLIPSMPTPGYDNADETLPANARLRDYTLQNNAILKLGTSYTEKTLTDGLSSPTQYQVGIGNDIAFVLSSSEAAGFLSLTRVFKGGTSAEGISPAEAQANFAKMRMPANKGYTCGMWLRSVGSTNFTVGALYANGFAQMFTAVSPPTTQAGYVYPAVWVKEAIFDTKPVDPGKPITESVVVDGRILTPALTGDSSDWVEIAQNGDYSLIVRADFMNLQSFHYGEPLWQSPRYSETDNAYKNSNVRNMMNVWFNRLAPVPDDKGLNTYYDVLPADARLRDFTVQNTAMNNIGTRYTENSLYDGLSKPTKYQVGIGNDIAFALSYSEVANFCSVIRNWKGAHNNYDDCYSPAAAVANFYKLNLPASLPEVANSFYFGMWLRSPGSHAATASALLNDGYAHELNMRADSLESSFGYGLVFPALWVHKGIFVNTADVTVLHVEQATGREIWREEFTIDAGDYGPYESYDFSNQNYWPGVWDESSAPPSGTIGANESIVIRYYYQRIIS